MKIRVSTGIFIVINAVFAVMFAGTLVTAIVIGVAMFPPIIIPAVIVGLLWSFIILAFCSSYYKISEQEFIKYSLFKAALVMKKESIKSLSTLKDNKQRVVVINVSFTNEKGEEITAQISGNLYDLTRVSKVLENNGYEINE